MTALDRVYGRRGRRGFLELLPRSVVLGVATGMCLVAAIAIVRFGPLLTGELDGLLAGCPSSCAGCWPRSCSPWGSA
jgi:hypothetical protein